MDKKKVSTLIKNYRYILIKNFKIDIEYLEARNIFNLQRNINQKRYRLFVAYYINKIRLIDNF